MSWLTFRSRWKGRPVDALNKLVQERVRLIRGETLRDAVVATAITVVRSLRAATVKAKTTAKPGDYTIEATGLYRGYSGVAGSRAFHFVPRQGRRRGAQSVRAMHPVNLAGTKDEAGRKARVWKITPKFGDRMKWEKNRNAADRCWYVYAYSRAVVNRYAKNLIARRRRKFSGLAQTAMGYAMAQISTRSGFNAEGRKAELAMSLVKVTKSAGADSFSLAITDRLDYAADAVKKGGVSIDLAMKKAANSVAGYLGKRFGESLLDPSVRNPFPDIAKGGRLAG